MGNDYYRGESKKHPEMIPSILRENRNISIIQEADWYKHTAKNLEEAYNTNDDIDIRTLGILQHEGFETRLLDITSNYDVARYFACSSNFDEDGYVYTIKPGKNIIEITDSKLKAESITRKLETIKKSKCFIENNINLREYFPKGFHMSTITKPVIIDPNDIYLDTKIDNLRLSKQKGSFILLGSEVDDNRLTGRINGINFDELPKVITIKKESKLEVLYELLKVKIKDNNVDGINFVNLFPNDSEIKELVSLYGQVITLGRREKLESYIRKSFKANKYTAPEDYMFKEYVDYMLGEADNLYLEFKENKNYFYFVFKELAEYFNYYYKLHRMKIEANISKEEEIKKSEKEKNEKYILYNLEVAREIVERIKRIA